MFFVLYKTVIFQQMMHAPFEMIALNMKNLFCECNQFIRLENHGNILNNKFKIKQVQIKSHKYMNIFRYFLIDKLFWPDIMKSIWKIQNLLFQSYFEKTNW